MRLIIRLRLVLAKAQLRTLLFCQRLMGYRVDRIIPPNQREFMFPHTSICIDTNAANYEFNYSKLMDDESVRMVLGPILEEFAGEQVYNDVVAVYRWLEDGTVSEMLMGLVYE